MEKNSCNQSKKIMDIFIKNIGTPSINKYMTYALDHVRNCTVCQKEYKYLSIMLEEPDPEEILPLSDEEAHFVYMNIKQKIKSENKKKEPFLSGYYQTLKDLKNTIKSNKTLKALKDSIKFNNRLSETKTSLMEWCIDPQEQLAYVPVSRLGKETVIQHDQKPIDYKFMNITKVFGQIQCLLTFKLRGHKKFHFDISSEMPPDSLKDYRVELKNIGDKSFYNNSLQFKDLEFGYYELIIKEVASEPHIYKFGISEKGFYE